MRASSSRAAGNPGRVAEAPCVPRPHPQSLEAPRWLLTTGWSKRGGRGEPRKSPRVLGWLPACPGPGSSLASREAVNNPEPAFASASGDRAPQGAPLPLVAQPAGPPAPFATAAAGGRQLSRCSTGRGHPDSQERVLSRGTCTGTRHTCSAEAADCLREGWESCPGSARTPLQLLPGHWRRIGCSTTPRATVGAGCSP